MRRPTSDAIQQVLGGLVVTCAVLVIVGARHRWLSFEDQLPSGEWVSRGNPYDTDTDPHGLSLLLGLVALAPALVGWLSPRYGRIGYAVAAGCLYLAGLIPESEGTWSAFFGQGEWYRHGLGGARNRVLYQIVEFREILNGWASPTVWAAFVGAVLAVVAAIVSNSPPVRRAVRVPITGIAILLGPTIVAALFNAWMTWSLRWFALSGALLVVLVMLERLARNRTRPAVDS